MCSVEQYLIKSRVNYKMPKRYKRINDITANGCTTKKKYSVQTTQHVFSQSVSFKILKITQVYTP